MLCIDDIIDLFTILLGYNNTNLIGLKGENFIETRFFEGQKAKFTIST